MRFFVRIVLAAVIEHMLDILLRGEFRQVHPVRNTMVGNFMASALSVLTLRMELLP
jgi:hypothetical protein